MLITAFLVPMVAALPVATPKDGVGKLPALGWNSWNAYGCNINEQSFLSAAQLIVDKGLKAAGYQYVNIDDCWADKDRDNVTYRLQPDAIKFPDGIAGTATKIHDMGLKIGIYSSAGIKTCAGYPASLGYEDLDAESWASWGIDYLKYDNCNIPVGDKDECDFCVVDSDNHYNFTPGLNGTCPASGGNWCPPDYDWNESNTANRYRRMGEALAATNRSILYSLCEWGTADVQSWGASVAQSWRSTGDISPTWERIKEIMNENSFYMNNVNFYAHSDPDMLEIGNENLTEAESRSHFTLWAAMKAPLLIGTDLAKLSDRNLAILTNKYLLAFNQDDQYGEPAAPYLWGTNPDWTFDKERPAEFWAGKSKAGTLVLALNTDDAPAAKETWFSNVPGLQGGTSYQVTDIWTGAAGCILEGIISTLDAHDVAAFLVGETC